MATLGFRTDLLRPDAGGKAHRVTYVELFFDLVFVFAVTQISDLLIHHQGLSDLVHTLVLTMIVWWIWEFTTWATNWLNPDRALVRILLIGMMLLGMLVSSAIPDAFTDKAPLFALALVAMQLARSIFTIFAFLRQRPDHAINFVRITLWHALPGAFWIWGAFAPENLRLWIWLAALALDYIGPRIRFWTPGLGRSTLDTWNVSGEHMAERVSLFFIIVLGESIIVTGTTFSAGKLSWLGFFAFLAAFVGTVLMWLLYFNHGESGGSEYLSRARERGLIAQVAYTYIPALMVIGIVLSAVADELVLREPLSEASAWTAGLVCGGAATYLLGYTLFKRAVGGPWLLAHALGIVALAVLFAAHPVLSPLAIAWLSNAILLGVVITDELGWRRDGGRRETAPA